ncbi:MAG: hypothetical protein ACREAY_02900 [Nitrososphaera sp.]|uniref:hypothetical protein n=1 Tax=Nitrososphaera sp. TaxID=1971748 RepID=UPI003D6E5613
MLDAFDTGSTRKKLIATIAVATAGMSLLVVLAGDQDLPFFTNWAINVTAGTAVGIAALCNNCEDSRDNRCRHTSSD